MQERIKIAHNASGSRVYDVLLESSTVPSKAKRQFVMDFIGHYHLLVDDRIGSRVGDRCWAYADTYLKVSQCPVVFKRCPLAHFIPSILGKGRSFTNCARTASGRIVLWQVFRPESQPLSPTAKAG